MYACMYVCMYVLYVCMGVCMYLCMYRSPEYSQFLITTTLSNTLHFVQNHFVFTF